MSDHSRGGYLNEEQRGSGLSTAEQLANAQLDAKVRELAAKIRAAETIPIRLHCPDCRQLHIDEGEFATKPHHTHACQHCGHVWRPAVVNTCGVRFLPGFKNDPPAREEG